MGKKASPTTELTASLSLQTLDQWLEYIQSVHFRSMDLTLDRVRRVLHRMRLRLPCKVITFSGTNGKGSTVRFVESIYVTAGYRVGAYTSPHLVSYGERIQLNQCLAEEGELMESFRVVDQARQGIPLTYFEFGTLAALYIFSINKLDVVLLEVGLGGRLDAVNAITSNLSCITPVSLDHETWLGRSCEQIGFEKAGVLRFGSKAVLNDHNVPTSIVDRAVLLKCAVKRIGIDYSYTVSEGHWTWNPDPSRWSEARTHNDLQIPGSGDNAVLHNAAGAVAIVESMNADLLVDKNSVCEGLINTELPGRIQVLQGRVERIFDVAHNPAAIANLAAFIDERDPVRRNLAVFSMLKDKDLAEVVRLMGSRIASWHLAQLDSPRATPVQEIADVVSNHSISDIKMWPDPLHAYKMAMQLALPGERVVVFGSFYLVGAILKSVSEDPLQA